MIRRAPFPLLLLLAAACASSSAKIPPPKVQIIARTNLSGVVPTVATGIAVHYELRITNVAEVPVTFTRADLDSMEGGGFNVAAKTRLYNLTIAPGETVSADFDTTAYINDPMSYASQAPVAIRAQLLFDSPLGKVQSIVQQRVSIHSGD